MSHLLHTIAPYPMPRREESMQRSGAIPVKPGAGRPSTATRTRRHSLSRVRAVLSGRRTGDPLGPSSRASAGSGVSPFASGASRGIALLSSR